MNDYIKTQYWTNFNYELYQRYLDAKLNLLLKTK